MPRNRTNDDDSPSHDSFLDVVANMVGILIILVMVAGVRVKNSPVPAAIIAKVAEADKRLLDKTLADEQSLRNDVFAIAEQTRDIEHETSIRNRNRELLATAVSAWQHKLDSRRKEIGTASREVFDLSQKMSRARQQFDKTEQDRRQVKLKPKPRSS
jgi:hypothetical protein